MDKLTLENMATSAFLNLTSARAELFEATTNVIEAKADLETAKSQAITGGAIDGKNEETRKAQLREHLESDYSQLAEMEKKERNAQHLFDRASIEVDTVKTLLRIAELI
jgi:hypothetical protein